MHRHVFPLDGVLSDARKDIEPEWFSRRQPVYEPPLPKVAPDLTLTPPRKEPVL